MFRLANFEEGTPLYHYLSSIASNVIYNALDVWGGSPDDAVGIYMAEFEESFFNGIRMYIPVSIVSPEINQAADETFNDDIDGRVASEILYRKIRRMKEKMTDPDAYYTFDLFEEYLFALMLGSYNPETFEENDPFRISSDADIAETAEILRTEYKVEDDLDEYEEEFEYEIKYADWLARTVHRLEEMSLYRSEEAGYESLFFWDTDYSFVFQHGFVEGIRSLVSGSASYMGYGYEDVTSIYTDIGLKAPLKLVGTEAAFNTVGEVVQEKLRDFDYDLPDGIQDEGLPFR